MDKNSNQRGRTVLVADWWSPLAKGRVEEIKEATRRDAGRTFTQEQLAKDLGVSPSTMTRNLKSNVNVKGVEELARALKLPRPVFVPQTEVEARAIEHLLEERNAAMTAQMQQHRAALATIEANTRRTARAGVPSRDGSSPKHPGKRRTRPPSRP
jgi:transcriptional regulator with XRE-family HTH domain